MKLTITNFQAISHASLSFPVGITTIVGASNSGKTSIIRALTSLLTNDSDAKSFIKYGEDKTEVTLEDVVNVKWSRTLKDSFYEIDGQVHQKVGKTDLFGLVEDTGFYKDEEDNIVNIQDEWSILYPFSKNSAQMYKSFEKTFAINNSSDVLKSIKDDESSRKKSILEHSSELRKNEDKLNKIRNFIQENPKDILDKKKKYLNVILTKYEEVRQDTDIVIKSVETLERLETVEKKEFNLSKFDKLIELENDIKYIRNNAKIIKFDAKITKFDFSKFDKLNEVEEDIEYINSNEKILEFDIPTKQFDFSKLSSFIELSKDTDEVLELSREYRDLSNRLKELNDKKLLLEEKIKSVKVCPLCKQEIKGDN